MIAFEFITGGLPFNADSTEKIFANIVEKRINWPPIGVEENMLSPVAYDFISKLMCYDPDKRLGSVSGAKDVK